MGISVRDLKNMVEKGGPVPTIRYSSRGRFYCLSEDVDRFMLESSQLETDKFMFQTGFVLREAVASANRWKRIAKALHAKYHGRCHGSPPSLTISK
jgi:hypothetical protein